LEGSIYYFGQYEHCNPGSGAYHLVNHFEKYGSSSSSLSEHGISVDVDGSHDGEIHCLKVEWLLIHMKQSPPRLLNFCMEFKRLMMKIPLQIIVQDEDELEENETVLNDC